MPIQIIDSFDLYNGTGANTGLQAKWSPQSDTTASMVAGRFGGQGFSVVGATNTRRMWARPFPAAVSALSYGFAFRSNVLPTATHWINYIRGAANTVFQTAIKLNTDGSLTAGRVTDTFGTISALGSSAGGVIVANTFHFIEVELVIHDTTGSFKVWVDGTLVINATGVDTRSNVGVNPADADTIWLGSDGGNPGPGTTSTFDDFYYKDTNAKVGLAKVEVLPPTSDVLQTFARSTGATNFSLVDEAQANGDTDYVQGSAVGDRDTYGFTDLSSTPASIYAVQATAFAEKTDAAARSIALQVISGATTSDGANFALASSYGKFDRIMETDPNTAAAWTAANVNALTGGPKVTV
jgi:hypothetical protein